MDAKRIIAIGTGCFLAFTPLAYCEIRSQEAQQAERIECIKAGGEPRIAGCRFPQ